MGAVVVTLLMMLAHCNGALWFVVALQRSLDDDCFVVFMCALRALNVRLARRTGIFLLLLLLLIINIIIIIIIVIIVIIVIIRAAGAQ